MRDEKVSEEMGKTREKYRKAGKYNKGGKKRIERDCDKEEVNARLGECAGEGGGGVNNDGRRVQVLGCGG